MFGGDILIYGSCFFLSLFMASQEMNKPLLLSAMLGNIEVEGVLEDAKRAYYSVSLYVEDNMVAKSKKSKPQSSVVKLEWKGNNQIWFQPSSALKIKLYRGFHSDTLRVLKVPVGKYEGKVVNLLENVAGIDLTDKEGIVAAKMKILLSRISGSVDNIEEFMKKVDDEIGRMSSSLPPNLFVILEQVGGVLKLTKAIMDKLSQYIQYSMHRGPLPPGLSPGFTRLYRRRISRMITYEAWLAPCAKCWLLQI